MNISRSFAAKVVAICLTIMGVTTISLSAVFFLNLRDITHREMEYYIGENVARLQDIVTAKINRFGEVLHACGAALTSFFAYNDALPAEEQERGFFGEDIIAFFDRAKARIPEASMLYYVSNIPWKTPGGLAVFSPRWTPPDSWDNTERSWFVKAKAAKGEVICTDPYVSAADSEITMAVSVNVSDARGNDIGVIAIDALVSDMHGLLNADKRFAEEETYLINETGLFVSHSDPKAVMTRNFFDDPRMKRYRDTVLSSSEFTSLDSEVFIHSSSVPNSDWFIVSVAPAEALFADSDALLVRLILFGGALILISAAVALVSVSRMLRKTLSDIMRVSTAIADLDFTADFQKIRADEIGDMQHALIPIRDNLKQSMDEMNVHLQKMTEHSARLNTVIAESSQELEVISGNMDAMQGETDTQMQSVTHTSRSVDEIAASIDALDAAVQTQASHITESSASIEEMVANIDSIRSVVGNVSKTTDTLSKSSASGHTMLVKLTEAVKRIQEQSAALQSANKTIADIAAQTNILAMNAAIEAAHAGESGKGFAVVAGEIRKLAELSGKESNAVADEIQKIERGIAEITGVSNQTVGAMDTIFTEIKTVDESFTQVNHAVEEQASGGSQILAALKTIQDMTGKVGEGAKAIQQQSGAIHKEMQTLERISQSVTRRAREVKIAGRSISEILENTKTIEE